MTITAEQVVNEARRYIGTPYSHQGRVITRALDCVGLVLCTADELNLVDREGEPFSKNEYPSYAATPSDIFVHRECQRRLLQCPMNELAPGCIVTMKAPIAVHSGIVGIIGGELSLIHAYNGGTYKCVEHRIDDKWKRRIVGVFKYPGVEY